MAESMSAPGANRSPVRTAPSQRSQSEYPCLACDETTSDGGGNCVRFRHQLAELLNGLGLRAVFEGLVRVGVDLNEQAVCASRDGGQRERRHQIAPTSALAGISDNRQV